MIKNVNGPTRLLIAILAMLGAGAASVLSQPDAANKETGPTLAEIRAMLAPQAATADEHNLLDRLVGQSKTESRMYFEAGAGATPLTSRGTTSAEWILGKRFVSVTTRVGHGSPEKELESESLAIYGFDTRTRKYTVVAFDTLGTYWVSAEGDYAKDAGELRLAGTVVEGGETMKFKWNVRLAEKGFTTTIEMRIAGDQWMKVAEVVSTKGE